MPGLSALLGDIEVVADNILKTSAIITKPELGE